MEKNRVRVEGYYIPIRNWFPGIFSIFPIGCGTLTDVHCHLEALTGPRSMRKNEKNRKTLLIWGYHFSRKVQKILVEGGLRFLLQSY